MWIYSVFYSTLSIAILSYYLAVMIICLLVYILAQIDKSLPEEMKKKRTRQNWVEIVRENCLEIVRRHNYAEILERQGCRDRKQEGTM